MADKPWMEPRERRGCWHKLYRVESCHTSGSVESWPDLPHARRAARKLALTHGCAHVRQGLGATMDHRGRVVATYGMCPEYARVTMRPVGR